MINLLSPQYKTDANREYYMRLGIVSLCFVVACVLIAIVFLIPTYLSVSVDEKIKKEELFHFTQSRDPELDKISTSIQSINKNLAVFPETFSEVSFPKQVLEPILNTKTSGVTLYEFFYSTTDPAKKVFSLRGDAVSRADLLVFVDALEETKLFEKVDVPISNLLRGDNVSFSLELTMKK